MSTVTYQQLLHNVALRLSALVGTQKAAIEASYDNAVLTTVHFKSADWPFNSFRDAILIAEEDFAWAIADTGGHPWRAVLAAFSPLIFNGGRLSTATSISGPTLDLPIIGVVSNFTDDGIVCTEQPLEVIQRINAESAWRTYPLYYYKLEGEILYHTRPAGVIASVCAYSRENQLTAFNGNDNMLLPDVLEGPISARAISLLTRDSAFSDQAAVYRGYSDEALVRIRAGLTTIPGKVLPGPTPDGGAR